MSGTRGRRLAVRIAEGHADLVLQPRKRRSVSSRSLLAGDSPLAALRVSERCRWKKLADVTARSFCDFRAHSSLSPKSLNDMLAVTKGFLEWLRGQQMVKENPLEFVKPIDLRGSRPCRRALTVEEMGRLLAASPPERAVIYLTVLYTGLRRKELNLVRWGDFDLEAAEPCLRLASSITKNRKDARLPLRSELVAALQAHRPADFAAFLFAFAGRVPKMETLRRDLSHAGIVCRDDQGRRVDLHALRVTFATNLVLSGAHPRVAQELMRHSDVRLTMRVYTDASSLHTLKAVEALPWIKFGNLACGEGVGKGSASSDLSGKSACRRARLLDEIFYRRVNTLCDWLDLVDSQPSYSSSSRSPQP